MVFDAIIQFFFSLVGLSQPAALPIAVPQDLVPAASASAVAMETVVGMEDSLQWSFNHRLPLPLSNGGFGPQRSPSDSLGILTAAQSAYVVDERTWSVLFDKASDRVQPMASITKLMTALVVLDQGLDPARVVTILKSDYRAGGIIHTFSGEELTMQDVWMLALIPSDNVAAAALARSTGLSEADFVLAMNTKAAALGMRQTAFAEPTGISEANVSTAHDIALLVQAAMKHVKISDAVRRPVYSFSPLNKEVIRTAKTTNQLLNSFVNREPYTIMGGKTGYTNEAGYCLAVMVDGPGATDDVIVVLLGAPSNDNRFQEVKGLVDWVYANYQW